MNSRMHTQSDGFGAAISITSPSVKEVHSEFNRLNSDEARLALMDQWLKTLAWGFERSWPVVYECGRLMRDTKTYQAQGFENFEAWWIAKMGRAFMAWAELEATHHFVEIVAPQLKSAPLTEVRKEQAKQQAEGPPGPRTGAPHGNQRARKEPPAEPPAAEAGEKNKTYPENEVSPVSGGVGSHGNSAEYLAGRIRRDRPDVAERMRAGEFGSVKEAARAAGIVKPKPSRVDRMERSIARLDPPERLELLRRLMQKMSEATRREFFEMAETYRVE